MIKALWLHAVHTKLHVAHDAVHGHYQIHVETVDTEV